MRAPLRTSIPEARHPPVGPIPPPTLLFNPSSLVDWVKGLGTFFEVF